MLPVTRGATVVRSIAILSVMALAACNSSAVYVEAPSSDMAAYDGLPGDAAAFGRIRFLFDDMRGLSTHTLETNALPWKVVTAALVLGWPEGPRTPEALAAIFQQYGFLASAEIANWSGPFPRPRISKPLGVVTAILESPLPSFRLEVANITCAACHAGVIYDSGGNPQPSVWLGQPNTSINFHAFTEDISRGLKLALENPERLIDVIRALYPDIDARELSTIRRIVLPAIAARLAVAPSDNLLGFYQGSSGLTNGLGSLKNVLGLIPARGDSNERGVASIPDLAGVTLRSSLLYDGSYGPKGADRFRLLQSADVDEAQMRRLAAMISAFTIPIMGVAPDIAATNVGRIADIVAFLADYEAPRFPGAVDQEAARRGEDSYRESCSSCHGRYSAGTADVRLIAYPNLLVPVERIGTDPLRAQLATAAVAAAFNRSPMGAFVEAAPTDGYVAPRLSGVWATAPYLHNGSVPTLWHLMHPEQRPARFEVGGHKLDFAKVGIAGTVAGNGVMRYPADYKAWARSVLYDTTELGLSNAGHDRQFQDLTETQKRDLLEYLKLL